MTMVPLDSITLRAGAHDSRADGVCLMEGVAWFAGERHSDKPACACPILGEFGRGLNDCLPDEKRIRLLQYVPRLVGTAGDGHQQARGLMAMDWIVRVYTPTWVALAGIDGSALATLSPLRSWDDVEAAQPILDRVRAEAAAAGAAAWDAARDAARAAARAAAWAAAGDAAGDAARDAAGAAAWDAARDAARAAARAAAWAAAGDAAWAAARDAAWAAAGDAAWAAARDAARAAARAAAWDAAGDAAWAAARAAAWAAAGVAVAPTRDWLQDDAIRLFGEMIALGSENRALASLTTAEVRLPVEAAPARATEAGA